MAKPKTKKATAPESVTPDLTTQAPRQTNQRFMLLAAIGIVVFFAIYLLRLDRSVGMFMDDAWYALLGKALATGQGYTLINSPTPGILPLYPPAYPFLLAIMFKVWPQFPDNILFTGMKREISVI